MSFTASQAYHFCRFSEWLLSLTFILQPSHNCVEIWFFICVEFELNWIALGRKFAFKDSITYCGVSIRMAFGCAKCFSLDSFVSALRQAVNSWLNMDVCCRQTQRAFTTDCEDSFSIWTVSGQQCKRYSNFRTLFLVLFAVPFLFAWNPLSTKFTMKCHCIRYYQWNLEQKISWKVSDFWNRQWQPQTATTTTPLFSSASLVNTRLSLHRDNLSTQVEDPKLIIITDCLTYQCSLTNHWDSHSQ